MLWTCFPRGLVLLVLLSQFIDLNFASLHWGTYRPHTLISARAPVPHSPFFGFIYHPANSLDIRHIVADSKEQIHSITWTRHDGSQFGDQVIRDQGANLLITTSFVAHPHHPACSIRVSAVPLDPDRPVSVTSLILYAAVAPDDMVHDLDDIGSVSFSTNTPNSPNHHVRINGSSKATGGAFTIRINPPAFGSVDSQSFESHSETTFSLLGTGSRSRLRKRSQRPATIPDEITHFRLSSDKPDLRQSWAIDAIARRKLSSKIDVSRTTSSLRLLDSKVAQDSSVLFVQRLLQTPFEIEATLVVSETLTPTQVEEIEFDLSSSRLDKRLNDLRDSFDDKFNRVFALKNLGFSSAAIDFAKQALSNLLGGIGFFYGSSLVRNQEVASKTPDVLAAIGLLTATPSRDVFPRGFLWDEGFHQLIVQRWDPMLSIRCLQSWLRASQSNGWIPREQILGVEARERFPAHVRHLMIQDPTVANPPTILMSMPLSWGFIKQLRGSNTSELSEYLSEVSNFLLSKTEQYYEWLKRSQSGKRPATFRWRGRSVDITSPEGYPLTLSSGLDDYPRSPTVSTDERHVDLHCWIAWAARVMTHIYELDGRDASKYWEEYHTLKASLSKHYAIDAPRSQNREDLLLCDYDGDHRNCHEGYVTILPLLLGLLDINDTKVGAILDALEDEALLRTRAGVRSLSKSDEWHRKGDDYWTGSVWMPFNFLTLAALKTKYGVENGIYRERALKIYKSLRKTVLDNTMNVFEKTGQFWENYSPDDDGGGKSGRQFTGWTSLVLLIMAEMFDGII